MSAQVISIGNEIMLGHIANTNAQFVSNKLASIGIKTSKHLDIPDNPEAIISSIRKALSESEIVITSGGLGPTVDDITLECIQKALNKKLIFNKKISERIKAHFKRRKIKMPANNLRQALLPEGSMPINNNIGTAPGLIIPLTTILSPISKKWERARVRVLLAFPGVPFELYPMLENTAIPYLKKHFQTDKIIKSRVIKITGLAESRVNEIIEDILKIGGNVQMGIYPHPEEIHVKITVTEKNEIAADLIINKIQKKIESRLKNYIFGYDNDKLEEIVGKCLLRAKKTLAVAESCTGGLLANRITDVPNSSKYFKLGLVTYSNEAKNKLLAVPMGLIKKYGSVSKQVAALMAKNVRDLASTDYGIGISGIAGPGGATNKKPTGFVYIALSTKAKTICKEFRFIGTRNLIKYKSTQAALNLIRKTLL
ncbi:MAG: competence/damage-inducible protein A [Candidatus Omnitrophica bacterium CG1_02_40_15]|nr:MAG: competence/damage-inducible protein A [Candidatus Omnitrophica bacterium CG1_02_40_15]